MPEWFSITSKLGRKWDAMVCDLGMRDADIAHRISSFVAIRSTSRLAIDVSHSGDQTSLDTIESSDKPIAT